VVAVLTPPSAPATSGADLRRLLATGALTSVLQPIWDLGTEAVVGYEALVRGAGTLTSPGSLFAAAAAADLTEELERACCAAAFGTAERLGLRGASLFVNVEPSLLRSGTVRDLQSMVTAGPCGPHVVLEITERALTSRPAELLATVAAAREAGWAVALDDVGAEPASLTFLELLSPDVVKLDMSLLRSRPDRHVAEVVSAVSAYAERTDALVLAEGIEDTTHLETALSLGARLGQGYLLGRPGPALVEAPCDDVVGATARRRATGTAAGGATAPSALLGSMSTRRAPKRLLVELSKHLEREAVRLGSSAVVISTFQEASHLTPSTVRRYDALAQAVGYTCVLGQDVSTTPLPGVTSVDLHAADPLCLEWDVVVLSPHFSGALLARDLQSGDVDAERLFEFAVTYDRTAVCDAARALLARATST
jgi:EAL domain-containing protein (putative c-di-GMP-specific phosphodiesterase class I)